MRLPARLHALVAVLTAAAGSSAFAARPLQTEDTGTQGAGGVEIENGLSWTREDGSRLFEYRPQVS